MNSAFSKYCMAPALGILTKKGASTTLSKPMANLPMYLHAFATGNATTKRYAGTLRTSGVKYHKSRTMGSY
jgi:hypothetical protein